MKRQRYGFLVLCMLSAFFSGCHSYTDIEFKKMKSVRNKADFTSPSSARSVIRDVLNRNALYPWGYPSDPVALSTGKVNSVSSSVSSIGMQRSLNAYSKQARTDLSVTFLEIEKVKQWRLFPPWPYRLCELVIDDDSGSFTVLIKNSDRTEFLAALYYLCPKLREPQ